MSSELSAGKHGPGHGSDSWGLWFLICKMAGRVRTSRVSSWGFETQITAQSSTRRPMDPIASLEPRFREGALSCHAWAKKGDQAPLGSF